MSTPTLIKIEPAVLAWLLDESGYTLEELAGKVEGVTVGHLDPSIRPVWKRPALTLTQARKLARVLRRPFAALLLSTPPKTVAPKVRFRAPFGAERNTLTPDERVALRATTRLQSALAWTHEQLRLPPGSIRLIGRNADPEEEAKKVRQHDLDVTGTTQLAWKDASAAFKAWRTAVERMGIHVFLRSLRRDSVLGFSLWHERTPLVVVRTTELNREAMSFTLFHELAHLLRRTDSACLGIGASHIDSQHDLEERWCDQFAAALLLPWSDVIALLQANASWHADEPATISVARRVASAFKVSLTAATLRLVFREAASWDLYHQIPKGSDRRHEHGGGKGEDRAERRFREYGARATGLLLSAMKEQILAPTEVMDHLDLGYKDLERLPTLL